MKPQKLLWPAKALASRLSFSRKFILFALLLVSASLPPILQLGRLQWHELVQAQEAMEFLSLNGELFRLTQTRREVLAQDIGGVSAPDTQKRESLAKQVESGLQQLTTHHLLQQSAALANTATESLNSWQTNAPLASNTRALKAWKAHSAHHQYEQTLQESLINASPALRSYGPLSDLQLRILPRLDALLAEAGAVGVSALNSGALVDRDRQLLLASGSLLEQQISEIDAYVRLLQAQGDPRAELLAETQNKLVDDVSAAIEAWRLGPLQENFSMPPAQIEASTAKARQTNLELVKQSDEGLHELIATSITKARSNILIYAGSTSLVAMLVLYLLAGMQSGIRQSVDALCDATRRMANCDFSRPVNIQNMDEIGAIARSLNQTQAALHSLFEAVGTGAREVRNAAGQVSSSADSLTLASSRGERIANDVIGRVVAFEANIARLEESASATRSAAGRTNQQTQQGAEAVFSAVTAMQRIATSFGDAAGGVEALVAQADAIRSITKVIEQLAKQTNMLALNAAIEAARAGEHGRGFAVVADEVRTLAERSSAAAGDINLTIASIADATVQSVRTIRTEISGLLAGMKDLDALRDVISSIQEEASLANSAADTVRDAVDEQRQLADDIARNMRDIAQDARTNTSATQASQEESQQLLYLADQLQSWISRFNPASSPATSI